VNAAEDFHKDSGSPPPGNWDLRGLLFPFVDKWWLLVVCMGVACLVTFLYFVGGPVRYAATVVIKFESDLPRVLSTEDDVGQQIRSDDQRSQKLKELQIVLKSRLLLQQVIDANRLNADPRFTGTTETNAVDSAELVGELAGAIRVAPRAGTTFLDVTVEQPHPVLAAQLANSLVDELIRLSSDSSKAISRSASSFLADEAQELQRKLAACETQLQTYRDKSLTVGQRQTLVTDNLRELSQRVNEAKTERIRWEAEYAPMAALATNPTELLTLPRIAADPAVASIRLSLAQQELEFGNIRQHYRAKHPASIQAQGRLRELQQAIADAALQAVRAVRGQYETAVNRETALTTELDRQAQLAQQLNTQSVPYNTLVRDMDQYRALYDSVVKRLGETTIASNLDRRSIQIFQRAEVPKKPVRPRWLMLFSISLLAGLGVGVLLIWGMDLLNNSLRTMEETEEALQLPVLSTVPRLPAAPAPDRSVVMNDDTPFSGAESFRTLRTSLFLLDGTKPHRCYLFTSTLAGEGKTFCSINYAASLARQGLRTLLVDCDLRRPMLEPLLLGNRDHRAGLADFLGGGQLAIHETKIKNLSLVTAGRPGADTAELLSRSGLREPIAQALRQFDRVVLDSAPIFGVSDTLRLVRDVDAVCLVVLAGKTPRKLITRCLQILTRAGAPMAGVILNAVTDSLKTAYGNPFYEYSYYSDSPRKRGLKLLALPGTHFHARPESDRTTAVPRPEENR
jgi:capsular exopolysaccharide synthesis family protein